MTKINDRYHLDNRGQLFATVPLDFERLAALPRLVFFASADVIDNPETLSDPGRDGLNLMLVMLAELMPDPIELLAICRAINNRKGAKA